MELSRLREELSELVSKFGDNLRNYRLSDYNETQVRVDYINPLFSLLGWDIANVSGLPQHLREVRHEATVHVNENGLLKSKKPDYSYGIGSDVFFYLETKKPAVDISADSASAFQTRRYGWSGNLKVSVLTNFEHLYIYDCSVRPKEGDNISVALIAHYHYLDYVENIESIYKMLSRESVVNGDFNIVFSNICNTIRKEPFDEYFLTQIRSWRNMLGNDVAKCNPNIDDETLNIYIQKTLNRILFLRVSEDRSVERFESLKSIRTFAELRALFLLADRKYDSGLFTLLEEDRLRFSDDVIIEIFRDLYYPHNSYEFAVIEPFLIGQIYELFLDEELTIQPDGSILATLKPEKVDTQGSVKTPKRITDIVVKETLDVLYVGKSYSDFKDYRIADVCCGSGNFLLSAFEYIMNHVVTYLVQHDLSNSLQRGDIYAIPDSLNYQLSFSARRAILENNIFGVDIDPLAVEVTKFSLLLKALENISLEELEYFETTFRMQILPNLDNNIKVGNSLIDQRFADYDRDIYDCENLISKIKMFNWTAEFGGDGFSAIVGNPPYIRVQNMVHYSPEEYYYFKSQVSPYKTASSATLDKYYLFIEKCLTLLSTNGVAGLIVPHKFLNIQSGKELRGLLSENDNVRRIIHFGSHQVFSNRSTYTCILLLSKASNTSFEIGFVDDLQRFLYEDAITYGRYQSSYLSENPWTFIPKNINDALDNVAERCVPLSEISEIFVGVQTSCDSVYIIKPVSEDADNVYLQNSNSDPVAIEKGILRKCIYDQKIRKYEKIKSNAYILFPYTNINGRAALYSPQEMEASFPLAYQYLKNNKDILDRRSMPNRNDSNWFAYGRNQSISRFVSGDGLVWPVLSTDSNYVLDSESTVFTGGGNGPFYGLKLKRTSSESLLYTQAILNHWLMELILKNKASTFRGGFYSHSKQFVKSLPIYRINFDDPSEDEIYHKIVNSVRQLMDLSKRILETRNSVQRMNYQRTIDAINNDLTKRIDELYGVEDFGIGSDE